MRNPAYSHDASIASLAALPPPAAPWTPGAPAVFERAPSLQADESQRSLERAMAEFTGAPATFAESSWNFTSRTGEPTELLEPEPDEDSQFDEELAQQLARTIEHRPLMNRIARIEAAYAELPGRLEEPPPLAVPPPLPPMHSAPATSLPSEPIEAFYEEPEESDPPANATAWLGTVRRERMRTRLHNIAAWFATIAIGTSVISVAVVLLQR